MMICFITTGCLFILFLVSCFNLLQGPYLEKLKAVQGINPKVSILIPARNEEKNIKKCLTNIAGLNYKNVEIIVYDDLSEDGTAEELEKYSAENGNIRVIRGREKPEGWTGKSWACHNLYGASSGEALLFMDADVMVAPSCLDRAVPFLFQEDLALLSCFPRQEMVAPGERLVVPLMHWILLSLLPLRLVSESREPALAAANGQFMLFRREAYERSGGHEALKKSLVEDVAFAHLLKRAGARVMTTITKTEVSCRMYRTFSESVLGFTKNFFPGFNMSGPVFLCFIAALFAAFCLPFALVFYDRAYVPAVVLILAERAIVSSASKQSILLNVLLHPLQMACMLWVGIMSFYFSVTGKIYWKGRKVQL